MLGIWRHNVGHVEVPTVPKHTWMGRGVGQVVRNHGAESIKLGHDGLRTYVSPSWLSVFTKSPGLHTGPGHGSNPCMVIVRNRTT